MSSPLNERDFLRVVYQFHADHPHIAVNCDSLKTVLLDYLSLGDSVFNLAEELQKLSTKCEKRELREKTRIAKVTNIQALYCGLRELGLSNTCIRALFSPRYLGLCITDGKAYGQGLRKLLRKEEFMRTSLDWVKKQRSDGQRGFALALTRMASGGVAAAGA